MYQVSEPRADGPAHGSSMASPAAAYGVADAGAAAGMPALVGAVGSTPSGAPPPRATATPASAQDGGAQQEGHLRAGGGALASSGPGQVSGRAGAAPARAAGPAREGLDAHERRRVEDAPSPAADARVAGTDAVPQAVPEPAAALVPVAAQAGQLDSGDSRDSASRTTAQQQAAVPVALGLGLSARVDTGAGPGSSTGTSSSGTGRAPAAGGDGVGGGGNSSASLQERMMAARRAVVMMQWEQHMGRRGRSGAQPPANGKDGSISISSSSSSSKTDASNNTISTTSVISRTGGAEASIQDVQQPTAEQAPASSVAAGAIQTGGRAAAQTAGTATPAAATTTATASGSICSTAPAQALAAGATASGVPQPAGLSLPLAGVRPALLDRTIQGRIARLQAAQAKLRAARMARVGAALQPEQAVAPLQPPPPAQTKAVQQQQQPGNMAPTGRAAATSPPRLQRDPASTPDAPAVADVSASKSMLSAPTAVVGASLTGAAAAFASLTASPTPAEAPGPTGRQSPSAPASSAATTRGAFTSAAPETRSAGASTTTTDAPSTGGGGANRSTPAAIPPATAAAAAAAAAAPVAAPVPPEVSAARDLLSRLSRYQPTSREDGPAVLAPYARYAPAAYQAAAAAAAAQPQALLAPLSLPQLAAVAAAYAAAGHRHEPLLEALASVALAKAGGGTSTGGGSSRVQSGKAGPVAKRTRLTFRAACVFLTALARLGYRGGSVTRLAAALGVWLARQLHSGAVAPRTKWKGTWLAAALWAYATLEQLPAAGAGAATSAAAATPASSAAANAIVPEATVAQSRAAGVASALPASPAVRDAPRSLQAQPQQPQQRQQAPGSPEPELELARGGVLLFTEAAEAVRVAPGWLHLLDGREALWSLWAFRKAAAAYGRGGEGSAAGAVYVAAAGGYALLQSGGRRSAPAAGEGGGGGAEGGGGAAALPLVVAAPRYEANPLVELKLAARATALLPQLDPGQLAEAHVLLLEAAGGVEALRDQFPGALAALRRCAMARADSLRPQPLAIMVAALAVMQVRDVVWLSALAMACRNKMINMQPDQIAAVLHAFGSVLRFHHLPLFHAAAVVCSVPASGMWRLGGMGAGEVLRLAAAYAATRHYEARLLRAAAERMLQLGAAGSSAGQRAGLLQSLSALHYRHNPLLRAVAAETFGLAAHGSGTAAPPAPPSLLVTVAEACGQLQHRPPGLLQALHASRAAVWPRMGLGQRATLCWALLVLTGGLPAAAHPPGVKAEVEAAKQQGHQRQQELQLALLLQALVEYLQALGGGTQRWPPTAPSSHHVQLLVACSVLASYTAPPATTSLEPQQARGEQRSMPASLPPQLQQVRRELDKLPPGALQRALEVERRARGAAIGAWAGEVAAAVREVLQEAGMSEGGTQEGRQRLPAASPYWLRQPAAALVSWEVSTAVEACNGAMQVDVAVELELELDVGEARPGVKARGRGWKSVAQLTAEMPGGEGVTGSGAVDVEQPTRRQRRRLRIALDLCPLPPPPPRTSAPVLSAPAKIAAGAGAAGAGAGGSGAGAAAEPAQDRTPGVPRSLAVGAALGGAVVRNSRWLLSGAGALRRRLLMRGGWLVVPVRERRWKELRSAEQRRRAVRDWLRVACAQLDDALLVGA
ncbi:hypothetical protein HYH02_001635 [Chlamydomonas schloesseri]|uniref:RAP domain-containing protein n=1 Tax=Chlamydomonas schloesseri TaxID=2026947 RepID=A0A836BBB0_9CHLO|nr:hypothetical protein HYH02_001635 [Chlamydomonas schloesseri]|eukprot:KAG2453412.1 hypothetical protein HYH02_001635 [Chlamydomonas schloesseri]